jgi:hypothetical protein
LANNKMSGEQLRPYRKHGVLSNTEFADYLFRVCSNLGKLTLGR